MALFYPHCLFYLVFEWQNKPSNLTIVQEKPVMSIVPPAASVAPPVAPVASIAPPEQEIWDLGLWYLKVMGKHGKTHSIHW
jgi:hypothetical protein